MENYSIEVVRQGARRGRRGRRLVDADGGPSATNITGHVTLMADADWRGLGPVALAEGATLNLNEHSLKIDALAKAPKQSTCGRHLPCCAA